MSAEGVVPPVALETFGALGYGVTAALFLFFAMLLLTGWDGRMQGGSW